MMKIHSRLGKAFVALIVAVVMSVTMSVGPASIASASIASQSDVTGSSAKQTIIPFSGGIACTVFYVHIDLSTEGKHFEGNGGGVFTISGASLAGNIYTADEKRLFNETSRFQVNGIGGYVNINFLNSSSEVLGSLHSAAIPGCLGIGGGTGNWTP